jgi:DNA-binding MarR family transcriptional regulator
MDQDMIGQVRRFNRTVTQRVGALDDAFLARGRPLGQARLLWEIGPDGADLRTLRSRLDLDSGYLSRLLRSLEDDGLAVVAASETDRRVRTAHLTAAGQAERAELDRRSDEAAAALRIAVADPGHPDARYCLQAYVDELARRFDGGFDPALSISAADPELRPPAGLFLVATLHGEPVGCGALKFHPAAPAEVKRMWVAPAARGLGLGRRLLAELEARAAASGVRVLRLETNRALAEAIGLYLAAGYREVPAFNEEPYAHHWFQKTL